jgi:hypothetical protein
MSGIYRGMCYYLIQWILNNNKCVLTQLEGKSDDDGGFIMEHVPWLTDGKL